MYIQEMTNLKYADFYGKIDDKTVLILTETKKKVDNIRVGQHLKEVKRMRKLEDKKDKYQ